MKVYTCSVVLAFVALLTFASAQSTKPLVKRPKKTRRYTTALTIDGGGMRCLIPSLVAVEIEQSIKRYLLVHPEYLPEDAEIESVDDFDVLLADFFDAMSGVSGGSWTTAYLSSKGGNGAADDVLSNRRIIRKYGRILPGQASGLEVFFMEYGEDIYPGGVRLNITPPAVRPDLSTGLISPTNITNPAVLPGLLPTVEIPGFNAPFFPVEGLEEALELFLGDVKLSELSTFYVVHAYDLIRRQNIYFVNDNIGDGSALTFTSAGITRSRPRSIPTNTDEDSDFEYKPDNSVDEGLDFYMKDVTRASSALAGFHEAKVMSPVDDESITYSFIDGAAVTNNPALQTLIFLSTEPRLIPIADVAMISLGTGISVQDTEENVDASALGWLVNNALLTILTDGSAENVQSQVDFLFYGNPDVKPGQYLRVQTAADFNTTEGDALSRATEPDDLPTYKRIGEKVVKRYRKAIDRFVEDFIFAE